MPFVQISLIRGKSAAYLHAIGDGVHRALVQAYGAPLGDRFQVIRQYERHELIYDASYLGIQRTDDVVFVNIIAGNWRDTTQKAALYEAIAANLAHDPGVRSEDVLIVLSPNARDEWSFGNGRVSYVDPSGA